MDFDFVEPSAGCQETIEMILLVGADFKPAAGDTDSVKTRYQIGYEQQDPVFFVSRSEQHNIVGFESFEDVFFGIIMDLIISDTFQAACKDQSAESNNDHTVRLDACAVLVLCHLYVNALECY